MSDWTIIALIGVVVATLALVGPALVYLGLKLGTLTNSSEGAHKRIDRLELMLTEEFRLLRGSIATMIGDAWKNCPLAHDGRGPTEKP